MIFKSSHAKSFNCVLTLVPTNNISRRLLEHKSGVNKSTKSGSAWALVFTKEFDSKSEAFNLEMKIKKRGISRFLNDQMKPG